MRLPYHASNIFQPLIESGSSSSSYFPGASMFHIKTTTPNTIKFHSLLWLRLVGQPTLYFRKLLIGGPFWWVTDQPKGYKLYLTFLFLLLSAHIYSEMLQSCYSIWKNTEITAIDLWRNSEGSSTCLAMIIFPNGTLLEPHCSIHFLESGYSISNHIFNKRQQKLK